MQVKRKFLQEHPSKLEEFFRQAPDILMIADFAGYIRDINPGAERLLGFTQAEFKARPYLEFVPPENREAAEGELHTLTEGAEILNVEARCLCKDGSQKWISWAARAVPSEQLIYAVGHDITERKKLDQARSEFVSFMAHQLKTPLVEMKGFLDNMMGGLAGELTPKQAEYIRKMQIINSRNVRLISDLFNVSKLERGMILPDLQPVEINKAVCFALEEYSEQIRKKGLALRLESAEQEIWVKADLDRLVEALKNLLNNAEKFTDKGSITVKTRSDEHCGYVEITDTGLGIPDDIFAKPFSKQWALSGSPRPRGGSGLGLYITRKFLELQHGEVEAIRLPDGGTRFIVKLAKSK